MVANEDESIKLNILEAAEGKKKSQVHEFLGNDFDSKFNFSDFLNDFSFILNIHDFRSSLQNIMPDRVRDTLHSSLQRLETRIET